jgi:hypothetical protein
MVHEEEAMEANHQLKIRLPSDVKSYLSSEAIRNSSTLNSEVVRAIRERMERANKAGLDGAATPARP